MNILLNNEGKANVPIPNEYYGQNEEFNNLAIIKKTQSIGVFDSGIGGITTLSVLIKKLPNENFIYLSDEGHAPYGNKTDDFIFDRTLFACNYFASRGVKAIIIACNTATNVAIERIRRDKRFSRFIDKGCLIFGLEPNVRLMDREALKNNNIDKVFSPHKLNIEKIINVKKNSDVKKTLVLLTKATSCSEKFQNLLKNQNLERYIICPCENLATLIEQNIFDLQRLKSVVYSFLSRFSDVGSVVLGCSHYIFIKKHIASFYGNAVKIYDGNEGLALRVRNILKENKLLNEKTNSVGVEFIKT